MESKVGPGSWGQEAPVQSLDLALHSFPKDLGCWAEMGSSKGGRPGVKEDTVSP